ncbi:D-2-hydroxyacid dehydrogenase family protein [Roseinatronobacter alkalisoli]|uniref:D-2-hydroxyacid dehydrogenase family protein n=1 Tax=Roseinatronobacter alkalisoli TaxID=3028235 RepID=A0ABT5TDD1_9RHOB|nr:D-2-hydroxyacid dehydrogenase family protein [Roseinatronobacter sp. HJB301]MDD7973120.1 D-2-hydroxyacid dehydrogenase family protein [Roseinatronobacter sp. HJB301]
MNEYRPLPKDRKARIAVLDDYMGVAHRLADWSHLEDRAEITFLTHAVPSGRLLQELAPYDALCLLRERTDFPAAVLRGLPNLKVIAATGRQNRTLDSVTAAELGIPIMTTDGSGNGAFATVELAWGLIIGLMRHIPAESAALRAGAWQSRLGQALYGRTLGLVGLGRLGARMALVAQAFGMKVIAWSPNLTPERAEAAGAEYADKATLFGNADIVSLHLVLGPSTEGIVGAADLARMKANAILINTARGPLVDQVALQAALVDGQIAGAGIDVFDHEPLSANAPIRQFPNMLATPHLGYAVQETFESFYRQTVENLDGWLDGNPQRLLQPK